MKKGASVGHFGAHPSSVARLTFLTGLKAQIYSIKELPGSFGWIIPGTKNANTGPFCGVNHEKSNFSLISDTFLLRAVEVS